MGLFIGEQDAARKFTKSLEENGKVLFQKRDGGRAYYVISDTLTESEESIMSVTGIPKLYETVDGKVCKKVSAKEIGRLSTHPVSGLKCCLYEIVVDFSDAITANNQQDGNSTEDADDPLERRPQYSWDSETFKERIYRDAAGDWLQTPAGEEIFFEDTLILPVLTITYFAETPFDPTLLLAYDNHVNDAPYRGAPRGAACVKKISTQPEVIEQTLYDKVTWQIAFKLKEAFIGEGFLEDTWVESILLQGYKYLDADGNIKVNKLNGDRVKLNLNVDGTARDPSLAPLERPVPTKYYADFSAVPQINF